MPPPSKMTRDVIRTVHRHSPSPIVITIIMILLIKAFTSGLSSDIMTRDGAVVRGISPRRRGQYNVCRSSMIIADDEAYDDEKGWGTGHLGHRGLKYL